MGKIEDPKTNPVHKYTDGQCFLHRVFGYRGVILFPWWAKLYDRDVPPAVKQGDELIVSKTKSETDEAITEDEAATTRWGKEEGQNTSTSKPPLWRSPSNKISVTVQPFYQVLIDSRDCPFVRTTTEGVTFLSSRQTNRMLYAIPGIDYVAHEDILPYRPGSNLRRAIHHELFEKFMKFDGELKPPLKPTEELDAWRMRNHIALELRDVHRETTENVRITVMPFYVSMSEASHRPEF